jgi:hypothetical protein
VPQKGGLGIPDHCRHRFPAAVFRRSDAQLRRSRGATCLSTRHVTDLAIAGSRRRQHIHLQLPARARSDPHEFAVAAFRLGHTLVRNAYVLHDEVRDADGNIVTGQPRPIFAPTGAPESTGLSATTPCNRATSSTGDIFTM